MKAIITVLLSLWMLGTGLLFSQITFQKTFGGTGDDFSVDILRTNDGGTMLVGNTTSYGQGGFDVLAIKLDAAGDLVWSKTYGGVGNDFSVAIGHTHDDNFLIVGYTEGMGLGSADVYAIKIDQAGHMIWSKTYGGTMFELARGKALLASDGGFYISGYTNSYGVDFDEMYLLKIDSLGTLNWSKTYGGQTLDNQHHFVMLNNGDLLIGGRSNSDGFATHACMLRVDDSGTLLWAKQYSAGNQSFFTRVHQDQAGNLYGLGYSGFQTAGGLDMLLVKMDGGGNVIWSKNYGGTQNDRGRDLLVQANGDIIFTGDTESFGAGAADISVIRVDSLGAFEWGQHYGGGGSELAYWGPNFLMNPDGSMLIRGLTNGFGMGQRDFYLLQTDPFAMTNCHEGSFTPVITNVSLSVSDPMLQEGSGGLEMDVSPVEQTVVVSELVLCEESSCDSVSLFTGFTTSINGVNLSLTDNSFGDVGHIDWDFGDGTSLLNQGAGNSVVHTYQSSGTYVICQTIYGIGTDSTCTDSVCQTITIPSACDSLGLQAAFTTVGTNFMVDFQDFSLGMLDSLHWIFGNGMDTTTMPGISFDYTYATEDTFTACLIAYGSLPDGRICSDTTCLPVIVKMEDVCDSIALTADFVVSLSGLTAKFSDTSFGQDVNEINWNLDGINWMTGSVGGNVSFTFPSPGTYRVCLEAVDWLGTKIACRDTFCIDLMVGTTGVADKSQDFRWEIYPNPVEDQLIVSFESPPLPETLLTIYTMKGQAIYASEMPLGQSFKLEVKQLTPGLYVVMLSRKGSFFGTKKILVE
ncbi:MAG: PKD domain-containing protein [Bacteroidota bacterium]